MEMSKENCEQCYNDLYNHGFNGAKECWLFKTAKLIMRKEIHIDQIPPYKQRAEFFPDCYYKQKYYYRNE